MAKEKEEKTKRTTTYKNTIKRQYTRIKNIDKRRKITQKKSRPYII